MNTEHQDLIDDYLSGRLSDDALDSFEEEMIVNSKLQIEVREQIALREALHAESDTLLAEPPASLLVKLRQLLTTPAWSYAASVALVLLIPVMLLSGDDSRNAATSAVWRNVELTRSSDSARIHAPANSTLILSIDAYGLGFESGEFELGSTEGEILSLFRVEADEQQLINLVLEPLPPGSYQITLRGAKGETNTFSLRVSDGQP